MAALLILTNLPDGDSARAVARHLVSARLAACINILAPCRSVYRWDGRLEEAEEIPMLIKTNDECYAALEAAIREKHPYEVPEIVALPIDRGLPAYLAWLAAETPTPKEC
jgi:periplasmic divalent cation tolerance protein